MDCILEDNNYQRIVSQSMAGTNLRVIRLHMRASVCRRVALAVQKRAESSGSQWLGTHWAKQKSRRDASRMEHGTPAL